MSAPTLPTWQDYQPGDPDVCVWCRAPGCSIKSIEVQHGSTCPSVTGLWPVMPDSAGMSCSVTSCDTTLSLGDYYAEVSHAETPNLFITVCVPCSLLHRDEAWT